MSWSYKYDQSKQRGIIKMNRGDTPEFKVAAYLVDEQTGEQYEFVPDIEKGESVVFAVKQTDQDEDPIFFIHCEPEMICRFKPQYTRDLKEKRYLYELSVNIPPTDESDSFHCTFATGYLVLDTEIYKDIDSGNEY